MQVFSLTYIATYSGIFDLHISVQNGSMVLAILSAIIFSISFYEGKFTPEINNYKELILNTVLLNIVILIVFYHYVLFKYLPYTLVFAIFFTSVIFNIKREMNPTMIYVVGWSVLCLLLFVFDMKVYFIEQGYIDIVLMAFAVEAILFTTSISYKYILLKNQAYDYHNMLIQQSKMAKTGEMIGNITHQFRQPLNNISYILMNLKKRHENNRLSAEYFNKKFHSAEEQLQFLSKTIDDFKEFYQPLKQKEDFIVKEAIENSFSILRAELKHKDIRLDLQYSSHEYTKIHGVKNELSQVMFALLSNALEAFKKVDEPWIKVIVEATSAEVIIRVRDNAQGINKKDIGKIFEPYYSTKQEGSGIGLYLVKMIVEHTLEGKISVENTSEGAEFTLCFEKVI